MKALLFGGLAFFGVVLIGELQAADFFPFGVILAIYSLVSILWGCIKLMAETEPNDE